MTIPDRISRNRKPDAGPARLMGWYMPMAGVRYYKILTDVDVALGYGRIESVGWRGGNGERPPPAPKRREAVAA